MPVKDIVVHVDSSHASAGRLRLAADLARRSDACLRLLHVQDTRTPQGRSGSEPLPAEPNPDDVHDRCAALVHGVRHEFSSIAGVPTQVVVQRARYADLTIVGHRNVPTRVMSRRPHNPPEAGALTFGEEILFTAGRPVMLIPDPVDTETLGRKVAVAWNGSLPSARALSDALPLLETAEAVFVLTVAGRVPEIPSALPTSDIVANIRHHCAAVSFHTCTQGRESVGPCLSRHAAELGADLLVAGAYAHARLWEKLFGGTTQDLLQEPDLPLLMAH